MADFEPRRAEPGQHFGYTTREGRQREFRADAKGLVTPRSAEDVAILDGMSLPVARTEAKAPAKTKRPAASRATRSATPATSEPVEDTKGPGHPDAGGNG